MPSQIELTRGQRALVDEADFAELSKSNWHAHKERSGGWRALRHVVGTYHEREEISAVLMGKRAGFVIDHINRDKLDYTRDNLRLATDQENSRNRIRRNSIAPGVGKMGNGFTARITIAKGVRKFLGYFQTADEAAEVYRTASKTYFGEFSPFNT